MATAQQRFDDHERRLALHDKEIAVIRKLLGQGAKMLVKIEAAQARTEKNLDRFIRSLRGNGSVHKN
jgi:hypothetical protein